MLRPRGQVTVDLSLGTLASVVYSYGIDLEFSVLIPELGGICSVVGQQTFSYYRHCPRHASLWTIQLTSNSEVLTPNHPTKKYTTAYSSDYSDFSLCMPISLYL